MSVLLWAVALEPVRTLGVKKTSKEAWDILKIVEIRVDRVQEAKAQIRQMEFENLTFKDGEGVNGSRISNDRGVVSDSGNDKTPPNLSTNDDT